MCAWVTLTKSGTFNIPLSRNDRRANRAASVHDRRIAEQKELLGSCQTFLRSPESQYIVHLHAALNQSEPISIVILFTDDGWNVPDEKVAKRTWCVCACDGEGKKKASDILNRAFHLKR